MVIPEYLNSLTSSSPTVAANIGREPCRATRCDSGLLPPTGFQTLGGRDRNAIQAKSDKLIDPALRNTRGMHRMRPSRRQTLPTKCPLVRVHRKTFAHGEFLAF
jgi:hypothetical protein